MQDQSKPSAPSEAKRVCWRVAGILEYALKLSGKTIELGLVVCPLDFSVARFLELSFDPHVNHASASPATFQRAGLFKDTGFALRTQ